MNFIKCRSLDLDGVCIQTLILSAKNRKRKLTGIMISVNNSIKLLSYNTKIRQKQELFVASIYLLLGMVKK